jgi:ATPase subunit of ABC transporter with duplicated ATPase domains
MSSDVIYTMYRADKFYGPERQVLANISLSFLHGAKIGVLGPNGAGKSTLLRIMAGLEEPSSGVAELDPKATVGFLPQEPELNPGKDVRGNVEDGVRELRDLLDRFEAISAAFAEPDADFDALLAEQAAVQERIRAWAGKDVETGAPARLVEAEQERRASARAAWPKAWDALRKAAKRLS